MKIVHLPVYHDNDYQKLLMDAQREAGHVVVEGGGGGNFFRTALRIWKADVLHFHWLHPYLLRKSTLGSILRATRFLLEVSLLRLCGTRIVWTIHNLENHSQHHHQIEKRFTKQFARLCHHCITHSETAAEKASGKFLISKQKLKCVPHGNYIGIYPASITREDARRCLRISPDAYVYLFLGRIEKYKRVTDLIEAFKKVSNPRSTLVIAGRCSSAGLRREIEILSSDEPRIRLFLDRVENESLQVFFNAADVTVFPYRNILTSGAVVLAMSFRSRVIVPELPMIRETVAARDSLFFDPHSEDGLALALQQSQQKFRHRSEGRANFMKALEWNWDNIAAQTLAAYQE